MHHPVGYLSQLRWEDRVCEYMHARAIYNVLTHGQTVQKGGLNPQTPGKSHSGFTTLVKRRSASPRLLLRRPDGELWWANHGIFFSYLGSGKYEKNPQGVWILGSFF